MIPERIPFLHWLFAGVILLCLGCSSDSQEEPAKFRIGQFLITNDSATIEIFNEHDLVERITAPYGKLTRYRNIKSNTYLIKVKTNDQLILEKEIGFGRSGSYTLCLTGIPVTNQKVNKQSTMDHFTHIVEGAAALTNNNFLPQIIIQNDFAVNEPGKGKVRAVHLMPGTIALDLDLIKGSKNKLSFQDLKYPHTTEVKPLAPDQYRLNLKLAGSPVSRYSNSVNIEKGTMLTLYFISSPKKHNSSSMMIMGETELPKN